MLRLDNYERHYPIPAPVAGAFDFVVNGDYPNGAECSYDVAGVLIPVRIPKPIILYGLKAEFKEIATGNQALGVVMRLYAVMTNAGAQVFLEGEVSSVFEKMLSWRGELPNDWGFGVSIPTAAGLTTAHKLVLSAQYAPRAAEGRS